MKIYIFKFDYLSKKLEKDFLNFIKNNKTLDHTDRIKNYRMIKYGTMYLVSRINSNFSFAIKQSLSNKLF